MLPRRNALQTPWNGVSLGGWLLLEPGPSYPLFEAHQASEDDEEARCEWDLMKILRKKFGKQKAFEVIQAHRDSHITKADFQQIRACGLNAVRIPFGYWIVKEPAAKDIYCGAAIEYLDRAVNWAEECGLQVVLDLHGCPGGESGEVPCGRRQRPVENWHYSQWRMNESLRILELLSKRYASRKCVTGIAACNEPSNTVPTIRLCRYYDQAVDRIRKAGMPASRVAVVLPIFQRCEVKFIEKWQEITGGRHRNICFDVHCYHCFENEFHGKSLAQQLRAVEANAEMLRRYPMVVGEWSLALGCATWNTCGESKENDVYRLFASCQMRAFEEASHGHFFWNWTEREDKEWNYQLAARESLFSRVAPELPRWDGTGEDPLEEAICASPAESRVFLGDPIYIRVFHGRYVDVQGSEVGAHWPDKGTWQELAFWPPASEVLHPTLKREVRSGDTVRLRSRNGHFLVVGEDGQMSATRSGRSSAAEFVVHVEWAKTLRHRGIVYLRNRATSLVLDADEAEEGMYARWNEFGWWQQMAIEKVCEDAVSSNTSALLTSQTKVLVSSRRYRSSPGVRKSSPDAASLASAGKTARKRLHSKTLEVGSREIGIMPSAPKVSRKTR